MSIPAAVVRNNRVGAALVLAARNMPAERRRAAALDCTHDLQLLEADMAAIGFAPSGAMVAEAPGGRRARARDREGTQGTMYAAEQEYAERPRCLGRRTARLPRSTIVPERTWRPFECARCALPNGQARCHGNHYLPVAEAQAREPACASPHDCDGFVAAGCRAVRDSALARA